MGKINRWVLVEALVVISVVGLGWGALGLAFGLSTVASTIIAFSSGVYIGYTYATGTRLFKDSSQ